MKPKRGQQKQQQKTRSCKNSSATIESMCLDQAADTFVRLAAGYETAAAAKVGQTDKIAVLARVQSLLLQVRSESKWLAFKEKLDARAKKDSSKRLDTEAAAKIAREKPDSTWMEYQKTLIPIGEDTLMEVNGLGG